MKASTNRGTCQACGAIQKLPGGVLAKHGYRGICPGSEHPPFEQSCALVQDYIRSADAQLGNLSTLHASLLAHATKPECWHYEYVLKGRRSGYVWRLVQLERGESHGYPFAWAYQRVDGTWDRLPYYGSAKTLLDVATEENRIRAAALEREEIAETRRYIVWQRRRVQDWQPRPLLPL